MEMNRNDILSEIFTGLQISSDTYFRTHFAGDFSIAIPTEQRRIRFHLVLRGSCWLCMEGEPPVFLEEGDVALIPNGAAQMIKSDPALPSVGLGELLTGGALRDGCLHVGEGADTNSLLCGFCQFDEELDHPILSSLPASLRLRLQDLGSEPWLAATLKLIALEANFNGQGSSAILNRLIETIVIQSTRTLSARPSEDAQAGFIAALGDKSLSRAITEFHRAPEQNWQVTDLAEIAGMSRASFARHFIRHVGKPPMEYVRDWRLMRARSLLTDTNLSSEEIATRCGYNSLPSFSKLFKKRFGMGPGTFRRNGGRT
ncbi:AraC family transcriptional regulator [Pseudovibrio sp. JE062]|uniref:AraC family transcriptional regulator n=1 Tax=Pseudovibrio sp. JE062 TaxID=439495 RepID=UPI000186C535|nr:AraC family transcriptional regulator [Pseudovibrio sp. JE062]EEA94618.1 phosphoribosylaminoimidazole carboxylase, ATPase subunit [Pseudovibrio sp. JE062]